MSKQTKGKFELSPQVLREILKPIEKKEIVELLTQWGFKKLEKKSSKLDLFLKHAGTQLSSNQIEDLWGLRERALYFRSRSWLLFRFSGKKPAPLEPQDLITKCRDYLKETHLEFNNTVHAMKVGAELYLNLLYKGSTKIIEEDLFQFRAVRPIQRIRCRLNLEKGIIRINGRSIRKIYICLRMIEAILGTPLKPVLIQPYKISDFVTQQQPITKLEVVCPQIVGGFTGIEKISLEGSNIIQGLYNMQARQEVAFNLEGLRKVGPFSLAKSASARINNRGEILIEDDTKQDQILALLQD